MLIILWCLYACYLRQALQGDITKHRYIQEFVDKGGDEGSLEYVTEGDPVQEAKKSLEGGANQSGVLRVLLQTYTLQCVIYIQNIT